MKQLAARRPGLLILLSALVSAIPLLLPQIPPLTDLMGHLGRYRVQLDLAHDPLLQRFYSFDWALIPNLGVDLLIIPVSRLLGLEPGVKAIVIAIVMMTAAGFLLVGRRAQGRWPVAALFTLPLIYNYPFHFGFVNFCLAMGLAFLAFAWWMKLGEQGRIGFRAALFVLLSIIVWLAHVSGWGALGLFAFAAEYERMRARTEKRLLSIWYGALHCLPLALPVILMLVSREGAEGRTGGWFVWQLKWQYLTMALSDRWELFDLFSVLLIVALTVSVFIIRALRFNHTLGLAALFLALASVLLPRVLFGSAYADMRLMPYALAMGLLAIEATPEASRALVRTLMGVGALFFAARTAATTVSFARYDSMLRSELTAVEQIPAGARVLALTGRTCATEWQQERRTHLPSIALARKRAFINDQFVMEGAQLIGVHYPAAGRFHRDPSQMAVGDNCRRPDWARLQDSVRDFPRGAFDYLWIINPPASATADYGGLTPVWRWRTSALFRVSKAPPAGRLQTAAAPAPPDVVPARTPR